jgi:hypothetical protein
LIFVPNESSAAFATLSVPNNIGTIRSHFMSTFVFKQLGAWREIQNSKLEDRNEEKGPYDAESCLNSGSHGAAWTCGRQCGKRLDPARRLRLRTPRTTRGAGTVQRASS